jgi:hypothetical protein
MKGGRCAQGASTDASSARRAASRTTPAQRGACAPDLDALSQPAAAVAAWCATAASSWALASSPRMAPPTCQHAKRQAINATSIEDPDRYGTAD